MKIVFSLTVTDKLLRLAGRPLKDLSSVPYSTAVWECAKFFRLPAPISLFCRISTTFHMSPASGQEMFICKDFVCVFACDNKYLNKYSTDCDDILCKHSGFWNEKWILITMVILYYFLTANDWSKFLVIQCQIAQNLLVLVFAAIKCKF